MSVAALPVLSRSAEELEADVNERKAVGYHIWNIFKKLCAAAPGHKFAIESVRDVGYRFEVNINKQCKFLIREKRVRDIYPSQAGRQLCEERKFVGSNGVVWKTR